MLQWYHILHTYVAIGGGVNFPHVFAVDLFNHHHMCISSAPIINMDIGGLQQSLKHKIHDEKYQ